MYETAIDIIFNDIQNNFSINNPQLGMGDKLKWIKVRFRLSAMFNKNTIDSYTMTNMVVFDCDENSISIKSINSSHNLEYARIEKIKRTNIIDFQVIQ